jgi:hypothetical protein
MRFELLMPIAIAVCIVVALKIIESSRIRRRMIDSQPMPETVNALLEDERLDRKHSALKWSFVLASLGVAFWLIGWLDLEASDPETFGLLSGSAGVALFAYHLVISRRQGK